MSARWYYRDEEGDPVEITDRINRTDWELQERAEEGQPGGSTVLVQDPAMDLVIPGQANVWVLEDTSEATDDVLFGGITGSRKYRRAYGDNHQPAGRVIVLELWDRNAVWNRRLMLGADCKRPEETDVERVEWLMTTNEAGIFDDVASFISTANDVNMDKDDYRKRYRDQVVDDCAQQSGKNWWAGHRETGSGRETFAWYGRDSVAEYSSPLFLSNDPADWVDAELADGTSLVWPVHDDGEGAFDPSRLYTGAGVEWAKGFVYRKDPAASFRRDFLAPSKNVRAKARAIARAERYLEKLDTDDVRYNVMVELPAAKATMLRAGMRVPLRLVHVPGLDDGDFHWVRVMSCSIRPVAGGTKYRLRLDLAKNGGGTAEVPYTGEVFAGLARSDHYSGTVLGYGYTFEAPPSGWYTYSTTGPIAIDQGSDPFSSVTVSAPMLIRIYASAWASGVGGSALTLEVRVNGTVVGSDTYTPPGGFWSHQFAVDLRNYSLESGDVVSVTGTASGGWTTFGTNSAVLMVGRGVFDFDGGGTDWEGP